MKRLEIRNWEEQCRDMYGIMYGINYEIQYGVDKSKALRLSILSIRSNKYYQMSIDKDMRPTGDYQVWLYNMNDNYSYPMSITLSELRSKGNFIAFIETTIQVADEGGFSGNMGNLTTQPL